MKEEKVSNIKKNIEEIRLAVDEKKAIVLELDICDRVVDRLDSLYEACETCQEHLTLLDNQVTSTMEKQENLSKEDIKTHHKKVQEITTHLQEKHELVTDNYYMSIYMSLGLGFGLLIGLIFTDNIALGLPLGMVLGIAVGVAKDQQAKKQGKVI